MADVTIQMGHVPRTRGVTGTHREQEFVKALAPNIQERLLMMGHNVRLIGADDYRNEQPPWHIDIFVSLHTDGSTNKNRRGASVGYPDENGKKLAHAWKRAHQRHGYPGGFLPDNYTAGLRGYYYYDEAKRSGAKYRFLAEHGTTTNSADEKWLFENINQCAQAHADAISEIAGVPSMPDPTSNWPKDKFVMAVGVPGAKPTGGRSPYWILDTHGGVFTANDAKFYGSVPGWGVDLAAHNIEATFILPTPTGKGYLILDETGGIFTGGDAQFKGSMHNLQSKHRKGKRFIGIAWSEKGFPGYVLLADNMHTYTF